LRRAQRCAFQLQQRALALQTTGVARERAILAQHAVAGHHHADRVAPHGGPHGAHRCRSAQLLAERAIAGGVAATDGQQRTPHVLLKWCAARQVQRQFEPGAFAAQVLVQLRDRGS
jgi:hypothetical protein